MSREPPASAITQAQAGAKAQPDAEGQVKLESAETRRGADAQLEPAETQQATDAQLEPAETQQATDAQPEPAEAEPEAREDPSETRKPTGALRDVRLLGYVVLAAEFVLFCAWSAFLFHRFDLTLDFGIYHQGWYLIAHGHLDPVNTFQVPSHFFWQDHAEFIMWPLALLYWIPPHDLNLLWVQDLGVVVAQAVAFTWICELAQKYRPGRKDAAILAGAGLVLLVANPFVFQTISYDFHGETLAIAFLALMARDLFNGRRRAWVWLVPLLACGDVAYIYVAGLGLGLVVAARRRWLTGLAMIVIGVAALQVAHLFHADQNDPFAGYSYLKYPHHAPFSIITLARGIIHDPALAIKQLWFNRGPTYQNLASGGLLGVAFIWLLPTVAAVLFANDLLIGNVFASPGFQSVALYILVPIGTVVVLGWVVKRWPGLGMAATAAVLVQALYFTVHFGPGLPGQFENVPAKTAAALSTVEARIPASDPVIVSQAEVGRFSGRTNVQVFYGPGKVVLNGGRTWFVILPNLGITYPPLEGHQLVEQLSLLHATLVAQQHGVWVYVWTPPPGMKDIYLL